MEMFARITFELASLLTYEVARHDAQALSQSYVDGDFQSTENSWFDDVSHGIMIKYRNRLHEMDEDESLVLVPEDDILAEFVRQTSGAHYICMWLPVVLWIMKQYSQSLLKENEEEKNDGSRVSWRDNTETRLNLRSLMEGLRTIVVTYRIMGRRNVRMLRIYEHICMTIALLCAEPRTAILTSHRDNLDDLHAAFYDDVAFYMDLESYYMDVENCDMDLKSYHTTYSDSYRYHMNRVTQLNPRVVQAAVDALRGTHTYFRLERVLNPVSELMNSDRPHAFQKALRSLRQVQDADRDTS